MDVEIITIGDELLIGQIVDTNSAWISHELYSIGIEVQQIRSISDDAKHIRDSIQSSTADMIIMTGGLGPTKDDITKSVLCDVFEDHLEFRPEIFEHVKHLFQSLNLPMPNINKEQAELPSSCTTLFNDKGTAPGMWFERDGRILVSMPGVPYEMKHIMSTQVLPRLEGLSGDELVYKTALTHGIGESSLMERIGDWEQEIIQAGLGLAWLPSAGRVKLRISGKGNDRLQLESKIDQYLSSLQLLIPEFYVGHESDKIEIILGDLLRKMNWKLALAESCTGGYLAHQFTQHAGSSDFFNGAVIAYANRVKEEVLGVALEDLKKYGAVSEQVVTQMANGAKDKLNAECSIATSGIAGPGGGSEEKPVGTVWVAVSTPNGTVAKLLRFGKDRERNIERSTQAALRMLQKEILKYS